MKYIYIIFLYNIIFISCSIKSDKNELHNWIGTKLYVPEIFDKFKDNKIIVRFLGDCASCLETIPKWKVINDKLRDNNDSIALIFYVEVFDNEDFKVLEERLNFADQVIFDPKGSFYSKNLLKFSGDLQYHTFLVDKENKIILFGNPSIDNKILKKYFIKI